MMRRCAEHRTHLDSCRECQRYAAGLLGGRGGRRGGKASSPAKTAAARTAIRIRWQRAAARKLGRAAHYILQQNRKHGFHRDCQECGAFLAARTLLFDLRQGILRPQAPRGLPG